jgi:putative ABC transport system permease protein
MPAQVQARAEAVDELTSGVTQIFSIARAIQLAALVVAAFSFASTAFTVVLERRWLLGLQRTLGMSPRQIRKSLALEALAIGAIGAMGAIIFGLALGVLLCLAFGAQVAGTVPVAVPWPLIASCAAAGIVIAVLATHHPRRIATRTAIIDALRFE